MPARDVRKEKELSNAWVSLVEASRLLGQSRQTILTRAVKGELEGKHIAGRTVISRASVERALQDGSGGAA
jgi:hypothetical protein